MSTLISFLRGINMTGHNSVKMNDLSDLYRNLGFSDVETYIQSGNVVFSNTNKTPGKEISLAVQKAIFDKYGYRIAVIIRTIPEIRNVISSNPYTADENFDSKKMAVIFLTGNPETDKIETIKNFNSDPDKFEISGKEIFIYCPNGFGKSKIYSNFFEKKLGVDATARNWNTVNTILQIAEKRK